MAVADRISALANEVSPEVLAALAVEAREAFNLRHAPLLLLAALTRTGSGSALVADTIERVIQRADELSEFLAIYWRHGRRPLSKQMKRGLARAFGKFDAYQLAKYDRDGPIKLRDVLFLVHAKPKDEAQAALWKQVADRSLPSPDTWEVSLGRGRQAGDLRAPARRGQAGLPGPVAEPPQHGSGRRRRRLGARGDPGATWARNASCRSATWPPPEAAPRFEVLARRGVDGSGPGRAGVRRPHDRAGRRLRLDELGDCRASRT